MILMKFEGKISWVRSSFHALCLHSFLIINLREKIRFLAFHWGLVVLASQRKESTDQSSSTKHNFQQVLFFSIYFLFWIQALDQELLFSIFSILSIFYILIFIFFNPQSSFHCPIKSFQYLKGYQRHLINQFHFLNVKNITFHLNLSTVLPMDLISDMHLNTIVKFISSHIKNYKLLFEFGFEI